MGIIQVIIDKSTPVIIEGQQTYNRGEGGILIAPAGATFPADPAAGEWYWRSDLNQLFRRDDTNSNWVGVGATGAQGFTGATGPQGVQGVDGVTGATGPQGVQGLQGVQGVTGPQGVQGSQGITGWTGPQGATGTIGPTGWTGAQGPQGVQGATGPQGSTGAQGSIGAQGSTGVTGVQGSQGPTGAQGTQGVQGPTGVTGVQGVQGSIGAQGATGVTGVQGSIGAQGSTGVQGAQGAQGHTGVTGVQGAQGSIGAQGATGVQGFTGSQGAQGSQGSQGVTGATGPQGAQGPTGITGVQGTQGVQGVTGVQGTQGVQGPTGVTGVQGSTGAQGATGVQGTQGVQGSTGAQGTQGVQGSTGAQGTQGVQGSTGAQGATGPQGAQGAQGSTGAQGATGPSSKKTGQTIFVDVNAPNATDTRTGLSNYDIYTPFASIKAALAVASFDSVVIFPGTYTEVFPLVVPSGVTVSGLDRNVIVQPTVGTNTLNGFVLSGRSSLVDVQITGTTGVGVYCNANTLILGSPLVRDVVVTDCGIGVEADGGTSQINVEGSQVPNSAVVAGSRGFAAINGGILVIEHGSVTNAEIGIRAESAGTIKCNAGSFTTCTTGVHADGAGSTISIINGFSDTNTNICSETNDGIVYITSVNQIGKTTIGDSVTTTRLNSGLGPRAFNLIDTNANLRVWRWSNNTAQNPAIELAWGANESIATGTYWWDIFLAAAPESLIFRRRTSDTYLNALRIGVGGQLTFTDSDNSNTITLQPSNEVADHILYIPLMSGDRYIILDNNIYAGATSAAGLVPTGPGSANLFFRSDGTWAAAGSQGATGVTGPQGVQGATGPQGSTGVQGTQGVQGSTGAQGTQGVQGSTGAQGTQGVQGATGAGTQGATGVQGATGPQGGGLDAATHQTLRQLIHFIDNGPGAGFPSGAYKETLGFPFPTGYIWWESSAKVNKIFEKLLTLASTKVPTGITYAVYTGGVLAAAVSDKITYTGIYELSRIRSV